MGIKNRMKEMFEFDVNVEDKEQDQEQAKEFTQEEILKLVDDYQKKDKSIGKALADRADKEVILSKAQEILLGSIGKLANFLKELINADKSGEAQKAINGLTTTPAEPAKEEEKKPEEKHPATPTLDLDEIAVFKYLQSHPDVWKKLKKAEANMVVPRVRVFFRQDDPKKQHMLLWKDIESDVILYFDGDVEKAVDKTGWYFSEYRIADSEGNPTDAIFEEPKKGS